MRHEAVPDVVPAAAKLSRHRPTGGPVIEANVGPQHESVYIGLPHIQIISGPGGHVTGMGVVRPGSDADISTGPPPPAGRGAARQ
jgi:hypothetical protein